MRKHLIFILVGILLIVSASVPVFARPQFTEAATSGITLTGSVESSFPNTMTFKVQAESDAPLKLLRLHYIVERQNVAQVVSESWPLFTPGTSVSTQWVWDMRKSPLPLGTRVEYWWTARDDAGNTAEGNHARVEFADRRYEWQSISIEPVTLYWYKGNTDFANALMSAAQKGLQKIENDIGIMSQGEIRIYIYGSTNELRAAQLFAPDWQGGVTFGGFDVIAIGVSLDQLSFGLSATPHELAHWAIGRFLYNSYGAGLPTWLDEGLAMYVQGEENSGTLEAAKQQNKLISVRTLSSPFSALSEQAYISYAESYSIVDFMLITFGKGKMVQLLEVFRGGSTYDGALQQVYGFDQDGLDKLWRESIGVSTGNGG